MNISILAAGAVVGQDAIVEELSVVGDGATVADGERLRAARRPEPAPS